jgi:hypothetical protein
VTQAATVVELVLVHRRAVTAGDARTTPRSSLTRANRPKFGTLTHETALRYH